MRWPPFFPRSLPEPVRAYRAASRPRADRRAPLESVTFIVLDLETSGLDAARDRMLSLALVEVHAGRLAVERSNSWVVRQDEAAVNAATAVHGILPNDTAGGTPEPDVLTQLLPRLHGAVLVGHHIGFDAAVLDQALRRHLRTGLRNPLLDTALMAMRSIDAFRKTGYANQRPPTLDELCAHTGLPVIGRHTAAGDAFTTAQLFMLLCARLQRRLERPLLLGDLPLARP